jgi:hypothetical protein
MEAPAASATVEGLLEDASVLPYGSTKVAVLEEAVRLADAQDDLELGFRARESLVTAAEFSGAPEKALVAFTWQLAQCDRFPGRFDEWHVLWQYKWIVVSLPAFPHVPRERIESAIIDLETRYAPFGAGPRAGYKLRWRVARGMGQLAECRRWLDAWRDTRRDSLSDCAACDAAEEIEARLAMGDQQEALRLAIPVLGGRLTCAEVPHFTLAELLLPLLEMGEIEQARQNHERGYRLVSRNPKFLRAVAHHVAYLALTEQLPAGLRLLERHLGWALEASHKRDAFEFLLAARLLLARIAHAGRRRSLRLPSSFPLRRDDARYEVAAILDWLDAELAALAARFDERNSNAYHSGLIEHYRGLETRGFVMPPGTISA